MKTEGPPSLSLFSLKFPENWGYERVRGLNLKNAFLLRSNQNKRKRDSNDGKTRTCLFPKRPDSKKNEERYGCPPPPLCRLCAKQKEEGFVPTVIKNLWCPPSPCRLCAGLLRLLLGLLLEVLREADVRADGVLVPGLSGVPAAGVALVAGGVLSRAREILNKSKIHGEEKNGEDIHR